MAGATGTSAAIRCPNCGELLKYEGEHWEQGGYFCRAIPNSAPTDSPFTDPVMEEIQGNRDKKRGGSSSPMTPGAGDATQAAKDGAPGTPSDSRPPLHATPNSVTITVSREAADWITAKAMEHGCTEDEVIATLIADWNEAVDG